MLRLFPTGNGDGDSFHMMDGEELIVLFFIFFLSNIINQLPVDYTKSILSFSLETVSRCFCYVLVQCFPGKYFVHELERMVRK